MMNRRRRRRVLTAPALALILAGSLASCSGATGGSGDAAESGARQSGAAASGQTFTDLIQATTERDPEPPEPDEPQSDPAAQSGDEPQSDDAPETTWAQLETTFNALDTALLAAAQDLDTLAGRSPEGTPPASLVTRFDQAHATRDSIAGGDYGTSAQRKAGLDRIEALTRTIAALRTDIQHTR